MFMIDCRRHSFSLMRDPPLSYPWLDKIPESIPLLYCRLQRHKLHVGHFIIFCTTIFQHELNNIAQIIYLYLSTITLFLAVHEFTYQFKIIQ